MKIFVAGGTGVISRGLIPRLVVAGHEVVATTRSEANLDALRGLGAEAVVCDALEPGQLEQAISTGAPEVVVNQLTALPARFKPKQIAAELATTNLLRSLGSRTLMGAASEAGVRRVVAQSVAFAYVPGPSLAREEDPLYLGAPGGFDRSVSAILDLEAATLGDAEVEGIVLRYGYLYGPGTHYAADGSIAVDVRRRRFPIVGAGEGIFSFVHVDDAVDATLAAIESSTDGVYNIVDDDPAKVRRWLPAYAQALGAPAPLRVPTWVARLAAGPYGVYVMTAMRGASNRKAATELAWRPARASWHEGFSEILAEFPCPPEAGATPRRSHPHDAKQGR
jgi:nucleoside-diphosphate-sugar epimerase